MFGKERVTVYIPKDLYKRFMEIKETEELKTGMEVTLSAFFTRACREFVKNK